VLFGKESDKCQHAASSPARNNCRSPPDGQLRHGDVSSSTRELATDAILTVQNVSESSCRREMRTWQRGRISVWPLCKAHEGSGY
jgi:hypothetical protein